MKNSKKVIGKVYSGRGYEPNPIEVIVQLERGTFVRVGEFIKIVDHEKNSIFYGIISNFSSYRDAYSRPGLIDGTLRGTFDGESVLGYEFANIKILGQHDGDRITYKGLTPAPGSDVMIASDDEVRMILGLYDDPKDGLFIGHLVSRPHIPVILDINDVLPTHGMIVGTTRSGKSYLVGVLVEECVSRRIPVVIIDRHGEYSSMVEANDEPNDVEGLKAIGLEPEGIKTVETYSLMPKGNAKKIGINILDCTSDEIAEITQMTEIQKSLLELAMSNIKNVSRRKKVSQLTLLEKSLNNLTEETKDPLDLLISSINNVGKEWEYHKATISATIRKVLLIKELELIGDIYIKDLVQPGKVSVIDLSGVDITAQRSLTSYILRSLFRNRVRRVIEYPFIIVVEEAHEFAPSTLEVSSRKAIETIVREGAKYGLSLFLVSQRYIGISPDVRHNVGFKAIFRLTTNADINEIKKDIAIIPEAEIDALPHYERGQAIICGYSIRFPQIVKIRPRKTKHGGKTPKFVT